MTSSLREITKRICITFFIVLGSIVLFSYAFVMAVGQEAIIRNDIAAFIVMSLLSSSSLLVLLSKKRLSFWQSTIRYVIVFFLSTIFTLSVIIYMDWFAINFFSVSAIILMTAAVFTFILGILLAQTRLETIAYIDPLTGAFNRRYFMKTATSVLNACIKENSEFAIIAMDLDHFKAVNDTYGHNVGDEVLKIAVARACHIMASGTLLARFGGEEFIIMVTDAKKKCLLGLAWRIQKNLTSSPFKIGDLSINVTASFGIASKDDSTTSLQEIIDNSDKALYQAKNAGRNTVVYYES